MAEYTLKIKKIKTPTDANWVTTIPTEYTNIKGRVYDIKKDRDANKKADGTLLNPSFDKNGYWKASAELTGLITPFTNPIDNKVVSETKIEVGFEDIYGWEESSTEKMYFDFLADQCVKKMQKRYKELYGVDIDLSYTKEVEEKKVDDIPPTELYLKYISHVDGSNTSRSQLPQGGVTKVTFEVYEKSGTGADEKTTLLGKIDDLLKFEVDPLTKKISVLLSEINNVQIVNSKIDDWLNKNIDKLPKDTKYGLYEYPDEKKEIKTKEQIELDETAWEFPPLVIHGEFTFDVQEENLFKGVIFPFKVLEIIEVGEIKETPIPEQVDETIDEEIDEEYLEEESIAMQEMLLKIEVLNSFVEIAERKESNDSGTNDSGTNDTNSSSSPIAAGDDADFWSLIAVCACEDGDAQGRADVAQSIYNRVLSKMFGGSKIKAVVTSEWQYEPAFMRAPNKGKIHSTWKAIKNKETAIAALIYTKGYTKAFAESQLKETYNQISDLANQTNAKNYVKQRTDFLGTGLGKKWVHQQTGDSPNSVNSSSTEPVRRPETQGNINNIFANIVGAGSFTWGRKNKIAEVPNDLLKRFKGDIS